MATGVERKLDDLTSEVANRMTIKQRSEVNLRSSDCFEVKFQTTNNLSPGAASNLSPRSGHDLSPGVKSMPNFDGSGFHSGNSQGGKFSGSDGSQCRLSLGLRISDPTDARIGMGLSSLDQSALGLAAIGIGSASFDQSVSPFLGPRYVSNTSVRLQGIGPASLATEGVTSQNDARRDTMREMYESDRYVPITPH